MCSRKLDVVPAGRRSRPDSPTLEIEDERRLECLSLVADRTEAAIVITDSRFRIVYANEGFSRSFGWAVDDVLGREVPELITGRPANVFLAKGGAELREGRSVTSEQLVVGRDGHRYWAKLMCNPVLDPAGTWQYTVSILFDITNTKMHEVLNNRVLEAMARDTLLREVLEMVCEEVERIAPEISASILEVDERGVLHLARWHHSTPGETENILLDTNPSTMRTIETVHAGGVRLSMDDFGSGYSSLSYLRRLPISELKLDRCFVADLETDAAAQSLSSAILGIGKSLSLTVVAEGVETVEQNETLRQQGYPVVQGYLFSKPLAPAEFERWMRETGRHIHP